MNRLAPITAKELEKLLFSLGFLKIRQHGSHVFYHHPDGRTTTVPHHADKLISVPLLFAILHEIKLDHETFSLIRTQ